MTGSPEREAWADAEHLLDEPDAQRKPPRPATGSDEPPALYYPDVDSFVREFLAPTYRRHVDSRHRAWCPSWWRHAEALIRLEALWRAWEHLRQDPATGVSVWLRDHADHHMAVLFDPDGPFKYCNPDTGHSSRLTALAHDAGSVTPAGPGSLDSRTPEAAHAAHCVFPRPNATESTSPTVPKPALLKGTST